MIFLGVIAILIPFVSTQQEKVCRIWVPKMADAPPFWFLFKT